MRTFALLISMSLCTAAGFGQAAQRSNLAVLTSQNCPVAAYAQRWTPGRTVAVENYAVTHASSKITLHMTAISDQRITSAVVVLRGLGAGPHLLTAMQSGSDISETLQLTGAASGLSDADIVPRRVVNVRSLAVTELVYADGRRWKSSSESFCNITLTGVRFLADVLK